ncbi:MAG: glycosyltransferase [Leptolyngbyaceae cyanobacterium]
MASPALVYISFDVVPAPKGAAVHIAASLPIKPNSVTALAAAWGYLQQNSEQAQHLSTAACHHIEQHFTWTMAGRSLIHLYRTLLP